jgi:thymidylate kinase
MRLIVEGPDGSGKSTLAKELSSRLGINKILHAGGPKEIHLLDDLLAEYNKGDVILDRAPWLSEFVYPKLFDRKSYMSLDDFETKYWSVPQNVIVCIGKGDIDTSFKAHKSKEHLEHVIAQREKTYKLYEELITKINNSTISKINLIIYNFNNDSIDDLIDKLKRYLR